MKKNYSTLEIVLKITNYIKKNQKKLLIYTTYNKWKNSYLEIERNKIMPLFPEEIHKNFPLHDDVLKLIIKELVNKIPFSKPYILKKYELNKDGIDYLLFPSSNPKKMVILFSGYSEHKTYNRYSWYWDESELWNQEVIYLFLNDLTKSWYVGTDEKPLKQSYIKIIQETINKFKLNRTQIYTIGGSMGGYASLLFAIDMGLKGAIAVHPQITYKATRKHTANDWESQIRKCGSQFYDLTDFLFKRKTLPHFYIEYGEYEADRECAEEFLDKLRLVEVLTIFKKTSNKKHVTSNPSYDNINNIISLFEKFDMDG